MEVNPEQLGSLYDQPIPEVDSGILNAFGKWEWKSIPITEAVNEEPKKLCVIPNKPQIGCAMAWPAYYRTVSEENEDNQTSRGFGELAEHSTGELQSSPLVKVRQEVAQMLNRAQEILDEDPNTSHLQLVVVDGYRRIEVQQRLFMEYKKFLAMEHPDLQDEDLNILAQLMVSMPPKDLELLRKCPPPHSTGGSVDVILVEKSKIDIGSDYWVKKAMIDFGAGFDEMMHPKYKDTRSSTRFYEESTDDVNLNAKRNRRLIYNLMTMVGFTNYPHEFWHYDYGNQFNSLSDGQQTARYNFAGGLSDGKIIEDLSDEEAAYKSYTKGMTEEDALKYRSHFGLEIN